MSWTARTRHRVAHVRVRDVRAVLEALEREGVGYAPFGGMCHEFGFEDD